jgi:hypothetical protein
VWSGLGNSWGGKRAGFGSKGNYPLSLIARWAHQRGVGVLEAKGSLHVGRGAGWLDGVGNIGVIGRGRVVVLLFCV